MITKVAIKNFKKLEDVSIELGSSVVFAGPNNSGKTSALQAISLWNYGLHKWVEAKKLDSSVAKKRSGVALNRKDLHYIPTPSLKQLWRDLKVRELKKQNGKQQTNNVNILISVIGQTRCEIVGSDSLKRWDVRLEFIFGNPESCYVKPLSGTSPESIKLALKEEVTYLPPMSGLAPEEYKLELGTIRVYVGQGKTADVLRNLCWYVYDQKKEVWNDFIVNTIKRTFGIELLPPIYYTSTGKIEVFYKEDSIKLDLINCGRGLHQVLLLLTYITAFPGTVLLIDEPDAHLEILRQREIYRLLRETV
ncbi:MAG: AAA family ATPase, partial [Chitinispirillaceae bacterium]|nr:AAA family ATPase [Chitinispirillaceae bacterium]